MHRAVIGFGANLGTVEQTLRMAIVMIASKGHAVERVSPGYRTVPHGPPQPAYLNAAILVKTSSLADELLRDLLSIEASLGRVRDPDSRWGPRTIDLDILWHDVPVDQKDLIVPHPRLKERGFALIPMLDTAPMLIGDFEISEALREGVEPWRSSAEVQVSVQDSRASVMVTSTDLGEAFCVAVQRFGETITDSTGPQTAASLRPLVRVKRFEAQPLELLFSDVTQALKLGETPIVTLNYWSEAQWTGVLLTTDSAVRPVEEIEFGIETADDERNRVRINFSIPLIERLLRVQKSRYDHLRNFTKRCLIRARTNELFSL
ncbi:MAG: 2-amino-4-hydroxy-6-hydroxymethyldihydropteridine diphosphokinase [Polyangiales bacterium]